MAHPSRVDWVKHLQRSAGIPGDHVAWDRGDGIWDTASRAWAAHDPEATHHLVLQDDAIVCRDLVKGLEMGLAHTPAQFICLYVGTPHDGAKSVRKVDAIVERADQSHASWLVLGSSRWGVATVLPVEVIADMLLWCEYVEGPDDKRIGLYCRDVLHWDVWHTWPSLVDHRAAGSLVGNSSTVARRFIGAGASALDFDWAGEVVS
jgi:hypothetical protein